MKLSRKLLPAIAMLLVSAVMMSTASFAWFSTNTTATADGMTVKVASATNIIISDSASGTYKSTYDYNKSIGSLPPASCVPGKTPAFYYMSKAGTEMTADSHNYGTDSEFETAVADTQYIKITSYLKVVGELTGTGTIAPTVNVKVKDTGVAATATDSPVYPALRVLIVYGENSFLYAPVAGADTDYKPVASVSEKKPTLSDTAITNASYTTNGTEIISDVAAETPYQVDIYVWLEGQDVNCKAANAVTLKQLDISVEFNYAD